MTNVVTLRPAGEMLTLPAISGKLAAALVDCFPTVYPPTEDEGAGFMLRGRPPTPEEREEAGVVLARMRAAPRITAERLAGWLKAFALLANAPTGEDGRLAFCRVAVLAVQDLPETVLTQRAIGEALGRWEFWPSPAAIKALLTEAARDWRAREAGLAAVAGWRQQDTEPMRQPPGLGEIEAVRKQMRDLATELGPPEEPAPGIGRPIGAPTLSRATLNAIREHEAKHGPSVPVRSEAGHG